MGYGQFLDARRSGVGHRMVGQECSRQGDGVDEQGSLEGIEWVGTRVRQGRIAGLGKGPERGTPAEALVLENGVVAPGVDVAAARTADRILEQVLVGHSHLMVSLNHLLESHAAYIAEASWGELYASLHTASLPY